jgi:uncharacterized membrane protein YhaH (DUF805 family)
MHYFSHIAKNIKESFTLSGRSTREEFWRYSNFYFIVVAVTGYLVWVLSDSSIESREVLRKIPSLVDFLLVMPFLGLSVRRLHDIGKSGWWYLISFTIVGMIPLIYWSAKRSSNEANIYGPAPEDGEGQINFRLGLGIGVLLIAYAVWGVNVILNATNNWEEETSIDGKEKTVSVSRFYTSSNQSKLMSKVVLFCVNGKDLSLLVSTWAHSGRTGPLVASNIDKVFGNPDVDIWNPSLGSSADKVGFFFISDEPNMAIADADREAIKRIVAEEFTLKVGTQAGGFIAKVDANDAAVLKLVEGCNSSEK